MTELSTRRSGSQSVVIASEGRTLRALRRDEKLTTKIRRQRRLLHDVLWYLQHPGRPERELERRANLAQRIREVIDE
jgi:hypothetical protein